MALALSRTYAKELVSEGYVTVDGRPVGKAATKLTGTETVSVVLPPPRPMHVEAEDLDLDVIYQDQELAAINKPPGMVSHPTATLRTGTVVNALLGRMPLSKERLQDPADEAYRPGIVHRLDKDTSGVMVVAKNDAAHRHLSNSFKKRFSEKEYVAIVVGTIEDGVTVDAPIGRHPVRRQTMTVGGENPKSATTRMRVIATIPGYTLVKARPHTGRTHQLRVHLSAAGCPLAGDVAYGGARRITLPNGYYRMGHCALKPSALVPDAARPASKITNSWPRLSRT